MSAPPITCVILVGGRSIRMGGQCKASLITKQNNGEQTFLERLLEELAPTKAPIHLSTRAGQALQSKKLPIVIDHYPDTGPLGGLLSSMESINTSWIFLLACDLPYFKREIFDTLVDLIEKKPTVKAFIPRTKTKLQTTAALYRADLKEMIFQAIQSGDYSFKKLIKKLPIGEVFFWDVPENQEKWFKNINRLQDLPHQ